LFNLYCHHIEAYCNVKEFRPCGKFWFSNLHHRTKTFRRINYVTFPILGTQIELRPYMKHVKLLLSTSFLIMALFFHSCTNEESQPILDLQKESRIFLIGNNLCSRMMNFGHFETELHARYPDKNLFIRNMCDGGNTPGFRAHSGRNEPWAFPGAEQFHPSLSRNSNSVGHLETEDEWLTRLKADIILAFFGYNESFNGEEGIENFKAELTAFIAHTNSQLYNGTDSAQLVLISPIAYEDLSSTLDLPDGTVENYNLQLYTKAMEEVAFENGVPFVDVFSTSKKWMAAASKLTIDGFQLTNEGYQKLSNYLATQIFGSSDAIDKNDILNAVKDKNWFWHNDYKIPNGVHVFGRRYDPFGPDNYPFELKKIREMTSIRDTAIWMVAQGKEYDVSAADAKTTVLPTVPSNYKLGDYGRGEASYQYGEDAISKIKVPEGYKLELFASEEEFPDLANPVQMSFDNKGRLWVAVMPTYPHYKPGDPKPNDKLLIFEDTDHDGKADKQIVWADGLHIPVGFEFAPEGVYLSQGTNFKLLSDTDGDDKADKEEIILSGFDDHDTHHVISAFCADPSGAMYMGEGVFLHTNVETSYGPVRATNGGFYRYSPQRKHLERTAQLSIPNPWGIAFDEWGQNIFAETSGPAVRWMMPGSVKPMYGVGTHKSFELIEEDHRVRPTSGLEFIHSRHFPDEVQGDMLINNTIGFLGMKQHQMMNDGTGFKTKHRQDLVHGTDTNFRPVDMEFAPDGSLYFLDWHNVLIGHMQHNARDPFRDHVHGRIYRITYPSRPLVTPAEIYGASIPTLLDNLKLPEYRTRYRTKRELRSRDKNSVLNNLKIWVNNLDTDDARYQHHLTEALWVTWGLNSFDQEIFEKVFTASDFRARAAAARYLRYNGHLVDDQVQLLEKAASDIHGRVRLEAIVAASWLNKEVGMQILNTAALHPMDKWIINAHTAAVAHINGESVQQKAAKVEEKDIALKGDDLALYMAGKEIYEKDGYCGTCHQGNGKGLTASGFPPLAGTAWAQGSEDRLIKLSLKGLYGPIRVLAIDYPGQVPMTPYEGLLNDEELAGVLTYIRNSFGNTASVITPQKVKEVRASIIDKKGFYKPDELLAEHPME